MIGALPRAALGLLAVCALACGDAPPEPDPASRRGLADGEVVGFADEGGAHAWLGIPFAAPPVGPLRWSPPERPAPWSGVREALHFGSACPQLDFSGDVDGDEDCLYLNVFAPARGAAEVPRGEERLPVMVWIHGGGNSVGSAEVYDAGRLAAENDVVVVTVHYRLGLLGWFLHPALVPDGASPEAASGNWATLDLVRALEWVQENAAAFGGDPERVTVFGESAGGINVYSLLLSPAAAGLFQGAISQSGFATTLSRAQASHRLDDASPGEPNSSAEVLLKLLEADGAAADREAAVAVADAMEPAEIARTLRAQTPAQLLAVARPQSDAGGFAGGMYVAPFGIRDGAVIPDADPYALFAEGRYNRVPTILGTNRDEHKLFLAFLSPHVSRLGPIPIGFEDAERYDLIAEYGAKLWKAAGADEPAALMRGAQGPSVFAYRFDWDEFARPLSIDLPRLIGAGHAVEMLFVFGGTGSGAARRLLADPESAEALSAAMRSYWARFAATGDPGRGQAGELPRWSPWGAGEEAAKYLVFDSEADGGLRMAGDDLTRGTLLAQVASDPRLADPALRCEVYQTFVQWSDVMFPADYERVEDGLCLDHPLPGRTLFD